MITLDAGVLIALFTRRDAHHRRAAAFFEENVDELLYLSSLTHAEILVHPARYDREEQATTDIAALGITVLNLPPDSGMRLARLRSLTGLKLPDCCVILAAKQSSSRIATFDAALARAADRLGIGTVLH